MHVAFLGSLLVATAVSAANIAVQVGPSGALTYTPTNVNASVGDTIIFTFEAKNHTVTQSSFTQPCVNAGGINSGFEPVTAGATMPTFQFTVNSTDPLWFYCAQTSPSSHCKAGMVFAVNPTASKTFAQFQSNAETGSSSSGSSSGVSSGSGATNTATGSATAATTSSTGNAAVMIGSNFGGLLTVVGLVAGLSL
ncbi:Cupredoxin [Amanita muscaria]